MGQKKPEEMRESGMEPCTGHREGVCTVIHILFICHGNICRSPMSEFIMKNLVKKAGMDDRVSVSSLAATRDEEGNDIYPPARRKLAQKGIPFAPRAARQMTMEDYEQANLVIGMDEENHRDIMRLTGGDKKHKVHLLMEYTDRPGEVADPWFTGDFDTTFRDVLDGCRGVLKEIIQGKR